MFPLIRFLAILGIVGGGATLIWYDALGAAEQQQADRIACDYASEIFGKSIKQLTEEQANHVAMLTKRHFAN